MKFVELSRRPSNGKSFFGQPLAGNWLGLDSNFNGLERAFGDLLQGFGQAPATGKAEAAFRPHLDVVETDAAVIVKVELAGVEEKDVDVTLDADRLVIKGEKKREENAAKGGQLYWERNFGSFRREIVLQSEIERDQVTAKYRNGILEVTLPKTPAARSEARKIAITA